MKTIDILVVRIYINEASHLVDNIVDYLKSEAKVSRMSIFRAIKGFGETGSSAASFIDLSLNLPLVIEFFDSDKDKINTALNYLQGLVKPEHIIFWEAKMTR
ncbi:MAG: DUF190 domain-containing protein [Rickettsiella sp.]|nr:DUF190 domain-containing protein [Rickettsiella sp.]